MNCKPVEYPQRVRILSYNIQVGVDTGAYREYITQGWKHLLPNRERIANLDRIADLLKPWDIVSLQEVDAGSLRSGFLDLTEYLANRAGHEYWYHQVNRHLGPFARNSNGFLSRLEPLSVSQHSLPGAKGRGAMIVRFGENVGNLTVCGIHLALGRRARTQQLGYLSELLGETENLVVMGDLNAGFGAPEVHRFIEHNHLCDPIGDQATFPSWNPTRKIDYILVSESLNIGSASVINYPLSDHLPIGLELVLQNDQRQIA